MEFDALDSRPGLAIFDPIEKGRFELYTDTAVELEPASTDEFYFPVDEAVEFRTESVVIPNHISVMVRTSDGRLVSDETKFDDLRLPGDAYLLELQSTPMKLYVAVAGRLHLNHADGSLTVAFDSNRRIKVGARSFHERPVGTITVTDDVRDEIAAVSMLGSALKTTSCERSFPNLRGHPPRIERGDALDVPSDVERPDTGVELVLPPEREYLYPACSLAYYLGARITPGDPPRLVADDFEYPLDRPEGYEATVNRVLRQVFFLDCLTRTEGYYQVDLHERSQVEPEVDLDFADLYGRPLAEQVAAYLSVPFDALEPHVPDWHLTTDVVPTSENLPALPYFAKELSLLRTPTNPESETVASTPDLLDEFTRATATAGEFTRSAGDGWEWDDDEVFQVESAETVEHAWVGRGYPIGANKVTLDSLRRQADRSASDDSTLSVHVVCNDAEMREENAVGEFYGLRDFLTFDVTIHENTSVEELAELFEAPADFLHYIGHVEDAGFQCTDGSLDARSLGEVNVDAFLLNACRSYRQGELLVEKGSRGGVVTLAEVINATATRVGRTLARLLNCGFSLRAALNVAMDETVAVPEYITIGDGSLTVCQSDSGVPTMYRLHPHDDDGFFVEHHAFLTPRYGIGTLVTSNAKKEANPALASGCFAEFLLSRSELDTVLQLEMLPVQIDGRLYWSDEVSIADL